ncbi:MAG: UDP-glucose 4-epimerase GalE [Bacilli bacterium]|jgi:UDP-glucose 4-epimerase
MSVLVTGGTGYIGSHTAVELLKNKYDVVIVDNFANSKRDVLNRIKTISGIAPKFYEIDVCNKAALEEVFKKEKIDFVIHFAGLKAVGESVAKPLLYYRNNLDSTLTLLELMSQYRVKNIIFSSSATVYGDPIGRAFDENDKTGGTTNPYGTSKYFIERILGDLQKSNPSLNVILLRYFNPIGADKSGLLGEDPQGIPNNLMPYISQVAIGKLKQVRVFGNDYKTIDGTGVRDYIHVSDLASGHVAAIKKFRDNPGFEIYNLGTGKGTSVLELIHAFEKANDIKIPYVIVDRRPGDIDISFADVSKANRDLHWIAKKSILDACRDSWNFQKKNPDGIR